MKKLFAAFLALTLVAAFCVVSYADGGERSAALVAVQTVTGDVTEPVIEPTTEDLGDEIPNDSYWQGVYDKLFGSFSVVDSIEDLKDFIDAVSKFDLATLLEFDSSTVAIYYSFLARTVNGIFKVVEFLTGSDWNGIDVLYDWFEGVLIGWFS